VTSKKTIPPPVERFILTSIDSVPHLEAILAVRNAPDTAWSAKMIAQNLFISEKRASELMTDLCASGFVAAEGGEAETHYFYRPVSPTLRDLIDQMSDTYAKNLLEVTRLIHSKLGKQAQRFGDAFKWQNNQNNEEET
jgi:hypothetical protein